MNIKIWQTEEWKKNRDNFLKAHPFCQWHGPLVKSTSVHHPQKKNSISEKEYLSLKGTVALCKKCHFAIRKRLKLCPHCKTHYFKPKRGRTMCWNCFSKTDYGKVVKDYYDKHPNEINRRRKFRKRV